MELSKNELRVIGCLIEKSLTTPDQYPLSLNGLTNACNQKSNRDPVMSMTESEVQNTLDQLSAKGLVMNQAGATSRVAKYKHRFCNTEFSQLQLSPQELGIICVLFLRGPQTPGELRTRTNRLCEFSDVHETEQVLNQLCQPDENAKPAKVIKLAREPGKRESRYAHLFGETPMDSQDNGENTNDYLEPETAYTPANNAHQQSRQSLEKTQFSENTIALETRMAVLEEQVEMLQLELEELRSKLE